MNTKLSQVQVLNHGGVNGFCGKFGTEIHIKNMTHLFMTPQEDHGGLETKQNKTKHLGDHRLR